ncbi:MAG: hypothetical protein AAFS10_13895 [Myxococcota bacterium]
MPQHTVLFGEVGLSGEVRAVMQAGKRLSEVQMMGFERCVMARSNVDTLRSEGELVDDTVRTTAVSSVRQVMRALFDADNRADPRQEP